jgi:acylphosphatase
MNDDVPDQIRLHAYVEGRVQGVGFRYFVITLSEKLDLTGWVRNNDEEVEVIAEGNQQNLDTLLEYLKQGPRSAYVSNVRYTWESATREFKRFSVKHGFDF